MFNIDSNTNKMTIIKKDTASFDVALDNYKLAAGDKVTFTVVDSDYNVKIQKIVTDFSSEGAATIFLSTADTALDASSYIYDIQVDTQDGRVDTVVGPAKFIVKNGVTDND